MDKKKIVIGTLCALIMIMAVGYALLAQELTITGTSSITSNWQVEITNIREKEKSIGATTNSTNYTAITASFNTSLTSPGDYATYEVTVTNKGTLDAVLAAKPTITTGSNEAITYTTSGIKKGDKLLKNNGTATFTITVAYNESTTTQPSNLTSDIEVTLNYQQDLGQVTPYDAYSIGDKITFADSDWYVIKNSTADEDYIVLMREKILEGHSNTWFSGGSTNDYAKGGLKSSLERLYLPSLGEENLKEVDGYKIRLVKLNELTYNLGYKANAKSYYDYDSDDALNWVHDMDGMYLRYWTMSPATNGRVWVVYGTNLKEMIPNPTSDAIGIRPVINLLKSAIEE